MEGFGSLGCVKKGTYCDLIKGIQSSSLSAEFHRASGLPGRSFRPWFEAEGGGKGAKDAVIPA